MKLKGAVFGLWLLLSACNGQKVTFMCMTPIGPIQASGKMGYHEGGITANVVDDTGTEVIIPFNDCVSVRPKEAK